MKETKPSDCRQKIKTDSEDKYTTVATAPLAKQQMVADLKRMPSDFYKIVLQAKDKTFNDWIQK